MPYFLKFQYLFLLPLLLSAILSGRTFRHKWPKQYQLFAVLVILSLLTEVSSFLWRAYLHDKFSWNYSKNNLWIYNCYITVRLGILLAVFYNILHSQWTKKIIYLIAGMLIPFGIVNYISIQGPFQYNTYSVITSHIVIIILCLLYFKQLLQEPGIIVLQKEPMVWITLGTFLYQAASLPFLIMLGFLNMQQSPLALAFLPINDTLNLLMCTCYLISFLCKPQPSQHL
jgi:hypothetical protein